MNSLIMPAPITMSSQEIADLLEKRHDKVKQSIERLAHRNVIQRPPMGEVKNHLGQTVEVYQIGKRDSYVIVAQLSPEFTARLVDRWQELEQTATSPRLLTTTETLMQMLQLQAEVERRQVEQAEALTAIGAEVAQIKQAHSILEKMPSDCESIVRIRERMSKEYGLSEKVVDKIMRDSPFAPTIRVLVRNTHADGAHYSGFSIKEVSAIFRRFTDECQHSAGQLYTHPYVERRFKLIKKGELL